MVVRKHRLGPRKMAQTHSSKLPFIVFQGLNRAHKRTALLKHFLSLVTKWGLVEEHGSGGWGYFQHGFCYCGGNDRGCHRPDEAGCEMPLPQSDSHFALLAASRCSLLGTLKGAPQTFPLSLSKAGKQ